MKVSIIIVSYNEGIYLREAIESCLQQSVDFDYEIIIGDDGSDDNSLDIIEEYYKKHPKIIKYFVMDRDSSVDFIPSIRVSNLIKKALSLSSGEYINLLSGDDYFCDNSKLKKSLAAIVKTNKRIAVSAFKKIYPNGVVEHIKPKKLPFKLHWICEYIHISCFLFSREVFEKELLLNRFCDDVGLVFSLGTLGEFCYVDEEMFCYRQRNLSIMHKSDLLEQALMELLLLQDIMNSGRFKYTYASKFAKPLLIVFKNREMLKQNKYQKYILNSKQYQNDIIVLFNEYKKINIIKKCKILLNIIVICILNISHRIIVKLRIQT